MTTHLGKYLGARLRFFFFSFWVPEEYQSQMITLLLLPREKPFCPVRLPREDQHPRDGGWCNFSWFYFLGRQRSLMMVVSWKTRGLHKLTHLLNLVIFFQPQLLPQFWGSLLCFPLLVFHQSICSFLQRKHLCCSNGWTMSHILSMRYFSEWCWARA